jgi:hypothetical protein
MPRETLSGVSCFSALGGDGFSGAPGLVIHIGAGLGFSRTMVCDSGRPLLLASVTNALDSASEIVPVPSQ